MNKTAAARPQTPIAEAQPLSGQVGCHGSVRALRPGAVGQESNGDRPIEIAESQSGMKTAIQFEPMDVNSIPFQEASLDIWDKKYRLSAKDGTPIDRSMDETYTRRARACRRRARGSARAVVRAVSVGLAQGHDSRAASSRTPARRSTSPRPRRSTARSPARSTIRWTTSSPRCTRRD